MRQSTLISSGKTPCQNKGQYCVIPLRESTRAAALSLLLIFSSGLLAGPGISSDAVWIDVRSPHEYASGHLEGAVLIPFDEIEKGVSKLGLDKDSPIYLYCAVGGRAEVARQRLQVFEYTNVTNVGGLQDAQQLAGESTTLAADRDQ